jgi:uncharacterized lipoprotein YddW (UPF0748 family)
MKSKSDMRDLVNRYADAGFELMMALVKDITGVLAYPNPLAPVQRDAPDFDVLEVLAGFTRQAKIKLHPWYGVICDGPHIKRKHPDWIARNSRRKPARCHSCYYTCPANRDAANYQYSLMADALKRYDIDGIHLDFIRTGEDTCYCDICLAAYSRVTGNPEPEPGRVYDGTPNWINWRINNITRLVARVGRACHRTGRTASAAVFADYPLPRPLQSQNFIQWSVKGIVDEVIPMNYSLDHEIVVALTRNHVANWEGSARLWEGLCPAAIPRPRDLVEQIRRVQACGVSNIAFFSHRHITDGHLKAIAGL